MQDRRGFTHDLPGVRQTPDRENREHIMTRFTKEGVLKRLIQFLLDALLIISAGGIALLARFDFSFEAIPSQFIEMWWKYMPLQIVLTIIIFWFCRMYHYIWRNVSAQDVGKMVLSVVVAYAVYFGLTGLMDVGLPRSVHFIELMMGLILLVGIRCALRFWEIFRSLLRRRGNDFRNRVMLIGAGEAGRMLAREMLTSAHLNAQICCVIDDNESKWGRFLEGVPIVGGRDTILYNVRKYDISEIVFAIPAASAAQRKEILEICRDSGCRVKTIPGLYQVVNGDVSLSDVKDVQVEDLLGRESIRLELDSLRSFLGGKTVLVTGGGGSIGSELCRQIARYRPKKLVILDMYENNAYDVQQELLRTWGGTLNLQVIIASIRDKERIYEIFRTVQPDIVFHAAAHKHVPLMEDCPTEAVKNNIFGTYHVVRAAEKFGVEKFIMISSDKAVNPTNVMGATKRFCEMILQSRAGSPTEFCAVRFGNVLGSNGSVVPLFKKQIAEGGPVTITDKRIIRYFMTIPEAVQLVLEAGSMAKQSEIFVLDMGEPVKIIDLAENLIRLSGLEPYRDIEIKEVGLRPGEKLFEELLMTSETLTATENKKIFIEKQGSLTQEEIMQDLMRLDEALGNNISDAELLSLMKQMIPTYHDPEEVNEKAIRTYQLDVHV